MKVLPVRLTQCATCPFREDGWTDVRPLLIQRSLTEATPICHSTGKGALKRDKENFLRKSHLCRGARNYQLRIFHKIGFLDEPTDDDWAEKLATLK